MRIAMFSALMLVALSGCTLVLSGDDHRGGDGGRNDVDASEHADADVDAEMGDGQVSACDEDRDGHLAYRCLGDDCDDTASWVYPGAPPTCRSGVIDDCSARAAPRTLDAFADAQEVGVIPAERVRKFDTRRQGLVAWPARLSLVGSAPSTETPKFYLAGVGTDTSFILESPLLEPTKAVDRVLAGPRGNSTIALGVASLDAPVMESIAMTYLYDADFPDVFASFERVTFADGADAVSASTFSSYPTQDDDYYHSPNAVFASSGGYLGWVYHRLNDNGLSDALVRCTGPMTTCSSTSLDGVVDTFGYVPDEVAITGTGGPHIFGRSNTGAPRVFAWNAFSNDAITILLAGDLALAPGQTLSNRIGAAFIGGNASPMPYLLAIPTSQGLVTRRVNCNTLNSNCIGNGAPFVVRGASAHRDAMITRIDSTHFAVVSIAESNGTSQVYVDLVSESGAFEASLPVAIDAGPGELADVAVAYADGQTARGRARALLVAVLLRNPAMGVSEVWLSSVAGCGER